MSREIPEWSATRKLSPIALRPLFSTSAVVVPLVAYRTTTGIELGGISNRSECTRGLEVPGAYPLSSHTAGEDGGTGSSTQRSVPRPSAIVPDRCRFPYCASPAEAGCGEHAEPGGFSVRHKPCPPVRSQGENAAAHAGLGAAESRRAAVRPGWSRDSWLRSARLPRECPARHRSNGACCHV